MKLKHNYSGSSLLELRERFGTGEAGFYISDWWLNEDFAKDKAPKGIYEIDFDGKFANTNWDEQEKRIPKDWERAHEAVIAEAILTHYKETGDKLLEDWYHWGKGLDSFGYRVDVGRFGRHGLYVDDFHPVWYDYGCLRVCLARKLQEENLKSENCQNCKVLEQKLEKIKEIVK